MTRLRFSTAAQVMDAFPNLRGSIALRPLDVEPFAFLSRLLKSDRPLQAVAFCAFLLPRRDAVLWLCGTLQRADVTLASGEAELLKLAETWARSPSESFRRAALQGGMQAEPKGPAAWAALAAGWSGGNMTDNPDQPLAPPSHLAGHAAMVGVNLVLAYTPPARKAQMIDEIVRAAVVLLNQAKT
jgi:hypothetical protein